MPAPASDRRPLATPTQLSEFLGIPEKTLEDWRSKQTGPEFIRVGRHVRYRWSAVEKWLTEQTVKTFPAA